MINKSLLLAALTGVALTGTAFAFPVSETSVAAKYSEPRPIASTVVNPTGLPHEFSGAIVNVEFTLDAAGRPHKIRVQHVQNPVLERQIASAFSQWRFSPGASESPAKLFVLPLQLRAEDV